jgi:hypothetical protein
MSNYFANDMNNMADSIKANITVDSIAIILILHLLYTDQTVCQYKSTKYFIACSNFIYFSYALFE